MKPDWIEVLPEVGYGFDHRRSGITDVEETGFTTYVTQCICGQGSCSEVLTLPSSNLSTRL